MKKLFFRFGIIFQMLWDFVRGNYKGISTKGLITIIIAILYLIFPLDIVPDFIPFAGQGDDFVVLYIAYMFLEKDIDDYKKWKNKEKQ